MVENHAFGNWSTMKFIRNATGSKGFPVDADTAEPFLFFAPVQCQQFVCGSIVILDVSRSAIGLLLDIRLDS